MDEQFSALFLLPSCIMPGLFCACHANNFARGVYNLPLNDDNFKKMSVSHCEYLVKSVIFKEALLQLQVELSSNSKTSDISYQHSFLKTNGCMLNKEDIPGSLWSFQVHSGMVTLLTLKNYCVH